MYNLHKIWDLEIENPKIMRRSLTQKGTYSKLRVITKDPVEKLSQSQIYLPDNFKGSNAPGEQVEQESEQPNANLNYDYFKSYCSSAT